MNRAVDNYFVSEEISYVYEPELSITIFAQNPLIEPYPEVVKYCPFLQTFALLTRMSMESCQAPLTERRFVGCV
jgi:hypothetical protein